MEMWNGFACVAAVVDDHAIAVFSQAFFASDFSDLDHEVAEEFLIVRLRFTNAGDWFLGNDQDMGRGLGIGVVKGEGGFVIVDDIRLQFARNDSFEDGLAHQLKLDQETTNAVSMLALRWSR